jgi:hypothetical protein
VSLPALSETQSSEGIGGVVEWSPRTGIELALGTTPTSFLESNLIGALRFRFDTLEGDWRVGVDRTPVEDSLLSYAATMDPVTGQTWGGVVRERAYFAGRFGDEQFAVFGAFSAANIDGQRVDSNTEWHADAGYLQQAASGTGWVARVGGIVEATAFAANRSHFTIGHGGYSSPEKFLSIGPAFEFEGRRDERSFRVEAEVTWQELREEVSDYFPTDPDLQAASGNLRYPGDSREGIAFRLAASVEWRITTRTVAGVRLEGMSGEDADAVRLQLYSRRWNHAISDPVQQPPIPLRFGERYVLN